MPNNIDRNAEKRKQEEKVSSKTTVSDYYKTKETVDTTDVTDGVGWYVTIILLLLLLLILSLYHL